MSVGPRSSSAMRVTTLDMHVAAPFRLDLTVSALRRLPRESRGRLHRGRTVFTGARWLQASGGRERHAASLREP